MTLRINDVAPNFTADTTEGPIDFHEWIGEGQGWRSPLPYIRLVPQTPVGKR
jgi:hypothetical protein